LSMWLVLLSIFVVLLMQVQEGDESMTGYEKIKRLAKEMKCNIPDLLVLARQNDPFFAGSRASREKAEWFAELWQEFGYTTGVHLRRVHYQLVSQGDARKHDGSRYKNTERDWDYLCEAGKHARYLGLVSPDAFIDRRNPEPKIYFYGGEHKADPYWVPRLDNWWLPEIQTDLTWDMEWELPGFDICGYEYSDSLQPYHVEVWVEKSTMNDILEPLCHDYSVNLITGVGFMSITAVNMMLERVTKNRKPCRILYISDFDPAGDSMPVAVARQIEFWLDQKGMDDYDIRLQPIVLTKEQVAEYSLPRVPVKDSDLRKASFEEKYGAGAVELDALEALYPGELARIVEGHILQFRDTKLSEKLNQARQAAWEKLNNAWEEQIEPYRGELEELKARVEAVVEIYQQRLEELKEEMDSELEPYRERLNFLQQAIQNQIEQISVELPDRPEPEACPEDEEWLFDSRRSYFEQLKYYKARKGGGSQFARTPDFHQAVLQRPAEAVSPAEEGVGGA